MPELPEVERGRRLAERALVAKRIVGVSVADDRIVYDDMPSWGYRLGLGGAEDADDRNEEHTLSLDSGVKVTNRAKGLLNLSACSRATRVTVSEVSSPAVMASRR